MGGTLTTSGLNQNVVNYTDILSPNLDVKFRHGLKTFGISSGELIFINATTIKLPEIAVPE